MPIDPTHRQRKYPIASLSVGESVLIPWPAKVTKDRALMRVRGACKMVSYATEGRMRLRTAREATGIRVTRVS